MHEEEEEWIKRLLVGREEDIREVLSVQREEAVPLGTNYISDIFRLKLKLVKDTGRTEERSAICKILPVSEGKLAGVREQGFFPLEIKMYQETLPAMFGLLKSKDLSAEPLWPEFLGMRRDSEGFLMEDLSVSGFVMKDCRKGLDFHHCAFVLKNLAKFHALAAVLIHNGLVKTNHFPPRHFFLKTPEKVLDIQKRRVTYLAKAIQDFWPVEWHDYVESLRKLPEIFAPKINEMYEDTEYKFKTLNHGDLWVNNILFKYDSSGTPSAVRFVDFQFVHYHSSCLDVQYLLNSSLQLEYADNKQELFEIYYESLSENLKLFEYSKRIPTLKEMKEDYEKVKYFGFHIGLLIRPFMMNPPAHELERVYKYSNPEEKRCLPYRYDGEVYLSFMRHTLLELRKNGLL